MEAPASTRPGSFRIGFRTSIITVFIAVVLVMGLSLVYLSFARVTRITDAAASGFSEKVAQLAAEHIDGQFKTIRDSLEILSDLPSIQMATIENPRLHSLMAAMLRNNPQLFNLYVGYEDGSFLELDAIDRAASGFRKSLGASEAAAFRLVLIARSGHLAEKTMYLSESLAQLAEAPAPAYDPRQRPWYKEASENHGTLLTGPYTFYATAEPGYTLRLPLKEGRRGVIAGDILLNRFEDMLAQQKLGASGVTFLFNGAGQVVGHPQMRRLMAERPADATGLPGTDAIRLPGLAGAIQAWQQGGRTQQFFEVGDRAYVAAFHDIATSGAAGIRLAVVAPLDEFFSRIISERRALFALALAFVATTLPLAFWLGSMIARPLRRLARETEDIQRFEIADRPRTRSAIREIDELGRSVHTTRSVVKSFASFVPKQIVRQLVETDTSLALGGIRREVTVLFTDVADFTAKTEKADPAQVMIYTSRYFAALSEQIMFRKGTIDKFIGDAVMAFWNAPADDPDHTINACRAVLACLTANDALNREFVREGWPAYQTRFGLHVGDAVIGNIGSIDRMNYTALGANINLASRLEGLNKNYGTRVLVSPAVRERVGHEFLFRSVDAINPKGFVDVIHVSELRGERGAVSADEIEMCRRWEQLYTLLNGPSIEPASAQLIAFKSDYQDDPLAQHYQQRLHAKKVRGQDRVA